MKGKIWVRIWAVVAALMIVTIGFVNFLMDPLWLYSHAFDFNSIQSGFNERQQKTNLVQFQEMDKYDGLLLGSSRTAQINQNDFLDFNIFNYASNSMYPFEYKSYVDFFKSRKSKPLKYIVIGADFSNTNTPKTDYFTPPQHYIDNAQKPFYRYSALFSMDTLKYSVRNLKNYQLGSPQYYNRGNVKITSKFSKEKFMERYGSGLLQNTRKFIGKSYQYNIEYIDILTKLKSHNPDSEILVFTSPITADLLVSIIENGDRLLEYKRWLKNLVELFGQIYHFNDINDITTNLDNYADDHHYYGHVGTLIANKLSGVPNLDMPKNFGILLNAKNLSEYLTKFEKSLDAYKNPLPSLQPQ
jgi:hypothetical protein